MSQLRAVATEPRNMSSAASLEGQLRPELTRLDTAAQLNTMLGELTIKMLWFYTLKISGRELDLLPAPSSDIAGSPRLVSKVAIYLSQENRVGGVVTLE